MPRVGLICFVVIESTPSNSRSKGHLDATLVSCSACVPNLWFRPGSAPEGYKLYSRWSPSRCFFHHRSFLFLEFVQHKTLGFADFFVAVCSERVAWAGMGIIVGEDKIMFAIMVTTHTINGKSRLLLFSHWQPCRIDSVLPDSNAASGRSMLLFLLLFFLLLLLSCPCHRC